MRTFLLAALLPTALYACSAASLQDESGQATPLPEGIELAKSELTRDTAPVVSPANRASLVAGNTEFALALFKQSATPTANLVQSPHSISTALAMAYAGAAGQTKADLATALHFGLPEAELHTAFNWLDLQIESRASNAVGKDGKPARVNVDNVLFGANDAVLGVPFLDTLAINYGAGVQKVDFRESGTVDTINSWVAERTEQRIPKLLGPLEPTTRLVLVNTVYVNAAWSDPFTKSSTSDADFASPAGVRSVPFMKAYGTQRYADTEAAQIVELPLSTEGLVFDVILPKGDLAAFEAAQTGASLTALLDSLEPEHLELRLPKFAMKPATKGSIKDELTALGMGSAFSDSADFSRLVPDERIKIDDVVHKTFFEIDEDGLEAAAATAVVFADAGASGPGKQPIPMIVDRPFVVVLRDQITGQILFLGHIVDPSAK